MERKRVRLDHPLFRSIGSSLRIVHLVCSFLTDPMDVFRLSRTHPDLIDLRAHGVWLAYGRCHSLSLSHGPTSEIGSLVRLKQLFLDNIGMNAVPETIGQLICLELLHLSGNQLVTLPESLSLCISLTYLYVTDNKLKSVPDSLRYLQKLRHVTFDGNPDLHYIPPLEQCDMVILDEPLRLRSFAHLSLHTRFTWPYANEKELAFDIRHAHNRFNRNGTTIISGIMYPHDGAGAECDPTFDIRTRVDSFIGSRIENFIGRYISGKVTRAFIDGDGNMCMIGQAKINAIWLDNYKLSIGYRYTNGVFDENSAYCLLVHKEDILFDTGPIKWRK